ncbi:tyrosine-protein phosphatase [Myroides odoratimimus]|uniref:tyrosine-protein phosphatase n=1 Tax=Myroides odoratimimus TaxID=76832 RepID=UPI0026DED323|nr:tyrosine-protein phosphatase [Myroides odoratimimus]MDO5858304.1 tyrosine-protein phosphatase [Myroides odoratimimus]
MISFKKVFTVATVVGVLSVTKGYTQEYKRTLTEQVVVSGTKDKVQISFAEKGNYTIYSGKSKQTIDWGKPIHLKSQQLYEVDKDSRRPYYAVVNSVQDTIYVAERKIPFDKVHNFRDIGGIKTKDGRVVNWGRFYRADALATIQDSEFDLFNDLGITKVFDLRGAHEVEKAPNNQPKQVKYIHIPVFNEVNAEYFKEIEKKFISGDFTLEDADQMLLDANRDFASLYTAKFKDLVHQILEEDTPIVYHCSAGKDRTGFTSALLLSILNVDRATILDEYEMTNFYTQHTIEDNIEKMSKLMPGVKKINKEAFRAMMGVKKEFLQMAFDTIDQRYGGMDNYIKNQLGISDQKRKELIKRYTYKM